MESAGLPAERLRVEYELISHQEGMDIRALLVMDIKEEIANLR